MKFENKIKDISSIGIADIAATGIHVVIVDKLESNSS